MRLMQFFLFLLFIVPVALPQHAEQSQRTSVRNPRSLVQSLYQEVLARHPIGIPKGEDMNTFAPYLSEALLHRLDLATACGADWYRQNPDPHLKPAMAWLELGLFSGGDEQAAPSSFVVERTERRKGASTRVDVKLTYEEPGERPWIWHVTVVVVRENGRYAVDDVIYLKEPGESAEARLSSILSDGCAGPRWVGTGNLGADGEIRKDFRFVQSSSRRGESQNGAVTRAGRRL